MDSLTERVCTLALTRMWVGQYLVGTGIETIQIYAERQLFIDTQPLERIRLVGLPDNVVVVLAYELVFLVGMLEVRVLKVKLTMRLDLGSFDVLNVTSIFAGKNRRLP